MSSNRISNRGSSQTRAIALLTHIMHAKKNVDEMKAALSSLNDAQLLSALFGEAMANATVNDATHYFIELCWGSDFPYHFETETCHFCS